MVRKVERKLSEQPVSHWELVEVGVDWLTATFRHGQPSASIGVLADRWQTHRAQDGWELKPWAWNGYRGSVVDGVTWGTREDGSILRLSGKFCRQHFLAAMCWANNVSRIDLQVTGYNPAWPEGLASSTARGVYKHQLVQSGQTRTSLIVDTPKGETLNIGSRASNRYFRIYDKHAESDGEYEPGTWRWEIEYKQDRAWRLAQRLQRMASVEISTLQLVGEAFSAYNVSVPIVTKPWGWKERDTPRVTDDQRRLEWLRANIRPVVLRMHESFSADTLAEAIGLYGILDDINGYVSSWAMGDPGANET